MCSRQADPPFAERRVARKPDDVGRLLHRVDLRHDDADHARLHLVGGNLGIGEASKIGFIAYSAFFPVFTTTREGIKYVDPLLVRAAESLGASQRDILRYVIIPAAMPSIMTGLRLSFALSFFVIVAAEFIAAERGLGFLINDAREFFRVDRMLLGAAAIGLLGYAFNQLFGRLERVLVPWKD